MQPNLDAFASRCVVLAKYLELPTIDNHDSVLQNVCLFRHFNKLDRESVMRSKTTFYVDVWPINFFDPDSANYFDTCCLFLLQLACILNMVSTTIYSLSFCWTKIYFMGPLVLSVSDFMGFKARADSVPVPCYHQPCNYLWLPGPGI